MKMVIVVESEKKEACLAKLNVTDKRVPKEVEMPHGRVGLIYGVDPAKPKQSSRLFFKALTIKALAADIYL
ncbi:MAG: hypothetical protein Q7S34_03000 [bacterium]|nr:hypothetical protein [bacterium]